MKKLLSTIAVLTLSATSFAASEPEHGNFINIENIQCSVFNDSPIDVQLSQCVEFSGVYDFIITPTSEGLAIYRGIKEGEVTLGSIIYTLGAE
jgi:hypothetical protein